MNFLNITRSNTDITILNDRAPFTSIKELVWYVYDEYYDYLEEKGRIDDLTDDDFIFVILEYVKYETIENVYYENGHEIQYAFCTFNMKNIEKPKCEFVGWQASENMNVLFYDSWRTFNLIFREYYDE